MGRWVALWATFLGLSGCRAQVGSTPDDMAPDQGIFVDLGSSDAPGDGAADFACASVSAEICNNGCDDDRNGYVDSDDPACTPQVIGTTRTAGASLDRLLLATPPRAIAIDRNPVPSGAFASYERAFDPAVYLVIEGTVRQIRRLTLADGGIGTVSSYSPDAGYSMRDVCVFNGELVVVELYSSSALHRLERDGRTPIADVPLPALFATGCASDGELLYVAVHDAASQAKFVVFDKSWKQLADRPLPKGLPSGFDRCLDFAWSSQGVFYGLFVNSALFGSNVLKDAVMDAEQIYPFSFDGGVGAPIDAGVLHGIGAFIP